MTVVDNRRFGYWSKIGTEKKFGPSTLDSTLAWGLEVDWDGDGIYDGASESLYMCGLSISRGRRAMIQRTGQGFETIETGKAVFTLWNDDGRYDGWNSSSPLYPNVTYGKDCRIRVRDAVTGEIAYVFTGLISDIVPTNYGERPQVNIHVEDGWVYLRNNTASVSMRENISPDEAIGFVLDDVGWPERWGRALDVEAVDNIRFFWADGSLLVGSECEDIANSFFGYFFIDAQGRARFKARTTVETSVVDFYESDVYKDIHNPQPWVNQRNVLRIKTHPYESSGIALLYEQPITEAFMIPDGETQTIFAEYTFNGVRVPAYSLVTPDAYTDYQMNSASDGSGTDHTGLCTVTLTNLGGVAKTVIHNGSGADTWVLILRVRGVAIYEKNVLDVTYPADPSTVTQPKLFLMDQRWQQSVNQAADFCTVMGPFFAGLHPFLTIQIESNFDKQFGLDMFDIVTFTSDRLGIGGVAFRVGGIEHKSMDEGCQRILTTFYLEPYVGGGTYGEWPLVWGESTFGW